MVLWVKQTDTLSWHTSWPIELNVYMPSTVIQRMFYDKDNHVLRIVFTSGMVYDYLEVPEKVYEEMRSAFSKGIFFNQAIKDKYEFKKVNEE